MKLLYDHQIFSSQRYGGISRYFYELIKAFDQMEDVKINTSLLISNNHYISNQQHVKYIDFLPNKYFIGKHKLFNIINTPMSILKLKQQNFDIFHPTYYNPYFLKSIKNKPFVLTVYDMIHEKFKDTFSLKDKTSDYKKLLVEKASKIIAISKSTKNDLIDIFGTDSSKIEVVYLGNSMDYKLSKNIEIPIPKKYILFVGSRGGYKNFKLFIHSMFELLQKDRTLFVVCVGGNKFNKEEIQLFSELNITQQLVQFSLDDDKLAYFYINAQLFVFPSLYEGFGIPVLESFACHCPLVCSNTSSLPEVAGEAACYFDPYSESSIKENVRKVLENDLLRKQMILKGKEQLQYFSWEKTVLETKQIYERIIS
jgi:glycosyltransferase involved in cell wall biosynthesis